MTRLLADRRCCQYELTSRLFNSGEGPCDDLVQKQRQKRRPPVVTSSKSKDNINSPAQALRNGGVRGLVGVRHGGAEGAEHAAVHSDNVLGVTTYVLLTKRLCRGNVPCHGSVRNTTLYPDYYTNGNVVRFSRWTFLGFIWEIEFPSSNFKQLQSKLCTRQTIRKFDALLNCGVFRARPTCNVSKVARKHATLPNCCHIVMGHIYCVGSNSVHDNLTICKQCSIGAITLLEGRFATQRDTRYI